MINSKQKGNRAEREVAKIINKTLNTNIKRTPQSGGMDFKGDLIDTNSNSIAHQFSWEIKDRKQLRINDWWKQTTNDCPANKIPVLVFKLNGHFFTMIRLEDLLGLLKEKEVL